MITALQTAERTSGFSRVNNYVYQRHLFAYQTVLQQGWASKKVVEIGCGEGYGMQLLSDHSEHYVAIDKKFPAGYQRQSNTLFTYAQLPDLSSVGSNSFDTVICFQVIEHIRRDHNLLAEMKRILKPAGKLLLTTPNKLMSLTRNPFHVKEYTPVEMHAAIELHFTRFTLRGIFGNEKVNAYYDRNKESVQRITRYDLFNLQQRLPAGLLRLPYNILNHINRLILFNENAGLSAEIVYDDFYLDTISNKCLDLFVVAEKIMSAH